MIRAVLTGFLGAFLLASAAPAAKIQFVPSAALTLNPAYPQRGYYDVIAHTIIIRTGPHDWLDVRTIRLDLMSGSQIVASRMTSATETAADTHTFLEQPIEGLQNAQLLNPTGLRGLFGPDVRLAQSSNMGPNQALLVTGTYFAVNATPDRLRVTVMGPDDQRQPLAEASIEVRPYRSAIEYSFPLRGAWLEASLPILQSHHRFIPSNEFALDLFKVDSTGEAVHLGTADATHWYAYGEPVLAVSPGVPLRALR